MVFTPSSHGFAYSVQEGLRDRMKKRYPFLKDNSVFAQPFENQILLTNNFDYNASVPMPLPKLSMSMET